MKVKTTKVHGEDIRAGQFVSYPDGIYRVLRNDRDRRAGGGVFHLMGRDKNTWWRGYEGYDKINLVVKTK
tara:strand:- start:1244 stop:1453 length:210 start_codon:yes stop_codon:yes gene_type:complete